MVDETQRRDEAEGDPPERAPDTHSGTTENAASDAGEPAAAVNEAAGLDQAPSASEPGAPVVAEADPGPVGEGATPAAADETTTGGETAKPVDEFDAGETPRGASNETFVKPDAAPPTAPVASVPAVQPAVRRRTPWGAMLMSGLIGGAVVAGAAAYGYFNYLADDESTNSVIFARLGAVEMATRDLNARPAAAAVSPPAGDAAAVKDLEARLAKAEERLTAISTSGLAPTAAAAATDGTPAQAVTADVAKLTQQVADTVASLAQVRARADAALRAAESRPLDPAQFPSKGEVDALSERLAGLQRTIATLQQTVQQRQTETARDDRAMRLAVVAATLRDAVESGAPFAAEVEAAKTLMADPQAVALLAPYAQTGLPTAAALAKELADIAPSIEKSTQVTSAEGYFARLRTHAERLVSLRAVNQGAGNDVPAVTARVEALAKKADIPAALVELQKLPEPARAPVEPWIKKAQAREAAVAAARRIEAAAVAALANHP